jgi:hypothetical protein
MQANQSTTLDVPSFIEFYGEVHSDIEQKLLGLFSNGDKVLIDENILNLLGYNGHLKNKNKSFKKLIYEGKQIIPHERIQVKSKATKPTTFISLTLDNLLLVMMKIKTEQVNYIHEFLKKLICIQKNYIEFIKHEISIYNDKVILKNTLNDLIDKVVDIE